MMDAQHIHVCCGVLCCVCVDDNYDDGGGGVVVSRPNHRSIIPILSFLINENTNGAWIWYLTGGMGLVFVRNSICHDLSWCTHERIHGHVYMFWGVGCAQQFMSWTSHGVLHERIHEHMCVTGGNDVSCVQEGDICCDLCTTVHNMSFSWCTT